ncbi:hypothetical protein [Brevundimonas goettingensis]|uniref:Lipoprotein n=1 Tax=Brevundimonas goettingensis TaxID=2774190 RepID=A0A975BYT1_9CAUL|nr:hypothetical protein [Brevundimonas goettingensis]QTC90226.1 hypothetical protein IFJ75_13155 [Brevundimonas goettingensis]
MPSRLVTLAGVLTLALTGGGCIGLGGQRIGIDRADYTVRLRDSEKAELLSNIVALRFGDAPSFLSVASVISQYTRETSGRLHLELSGPGDDSPANTDGSVLFRETPTVTYTPMSGERFARSLLSPIPPASLLGMIEAGWAADDLFHIAVRSINGVRAGARAPLFATPADPDFPVVVGAIRRLQASGALSIRLKQEANVWASVARLSATLTDQDRADLETLATTLNLRPEGRDMRVVFAVEPVARDELAVTTRSMLEVLQEMGQGVDLTGADVFDPNDLIHVHSGPKAPDHVHVAVQQRGRWFWIEQDDTASIRAFLLAQILMSLNDDTGAARSPLVTIPAG